MVTFIKEKGILQFVSLFNPYEFYAEGDPTMRCLKYDKVFWVDGFKFVIGKVNGKGNRTIYEVSCTVKAFEAVFKWSDEELIEEFMKKIAEDGRPLGQIIDACYRRNMIFISTAVLIII